ncbi:TPA: peptidase [Pasteurella multocida]|uniref:peptidase n=1 Tax=Pasteurella canis TaxID=753 RepID=UPI001D12B526|nr:peptidase [Pasteurella canis]UDW84011.1 peptidase [Pasteurella canis]
MKLTKMAIMRLGTHTAMDGREISFTADMLNDIATSYDPQLSEAPIVIGHPKLTAPSYGWVKQASIEGDTLYAHVGQVEAAFADAVNEGRYKKRSASIFLPDSPGNPKPGHYYLNHIGFLGAAPPAVKGLGDVNFAASDAENAFAEFSFDIESINHQPQENPMDKTPEEIAAEKAAADKQREDDLKAREAALKAREDKVEKAEKAQKQAEKAALEQDAASFASEMVSKGKVLPAQKQALIEVLVASANQPISFSDGSQTVSKSSVDVIKEIISQKPMDFSAKSNEEGEEQGAVDFSDGASIASAASEYAAEQAQKGIVISMTDAVNHIMKGKKS